MPSLVVPFRGAKGKSRLGTFSASSRAALGHAMLHDVLTACTAVGPTYIVGPADLALADVFHGTVHQITDPGGGLGAAVRAGLEAAELDAGRDGRTDPLLVVNADLPCATARDLLTLAGAVPADGLALAPASDGTTNALGLSSSKVFVPVYGPGSAGRFAALAPSLTVEVPNLRDDVDTAEDLERLRDRLGPATRAALESVQAARLARPVGAAA